MVSNLRNHGNHDSPWGMDEPHAMLWINHYHHLSGYHDHHLPYRMGGKVGGK